MVTKLIIAKITAKDSSVLAKILMVTKPAKQINNNTNSSVLAKILMVTKQ